MIKQTCKAVTTKCDTSPLPKLGTAQLPHHSKHTYCIVLKVSPLPKVSSLPLYNIFLMDKHSGETPFRE